MLTRCRWLSPCQWRLLQHPLAGEGPRVRVTSSSRVLLKGHGARTQSGAQEGLCSCTGGLGTVVAAGPVVEHTEPLLRPGCSCLAPQQLLPCRCCKQEQITDGSAVPGTYLHKYLRLPSPVLNTCMLWVWVLFVVHHKLQLL